MITASIGEPDGFADNPWALVASRLVERGVVVTVSAGNEGMTGPFYASSGSSGHGVLAIAAVNVTGNPRVSTFDSRFAPLPAYFTSWGPLNDLELKPDIAAPGYEIVSTWLNQSYEDISGTSMSAPYIAGVAALYIGEHGGREFYGPGFAKMLSDRIKSSGRSLGWDVGNGKLNATAPPIQVGTGLVDAWKVLKYDTQLTFEPFSLMDKDHFVSKWSADITNHGNRPLRYTFKVEPQSGMNILDTAYGIRSAFDLEPLRIVPPVTLPKSVIVNPARTKTVE